MTDEERKELEATVKFTTVSPTVEVKEMKPAENGGFKEETVVVGREFPDLKEIAENAGRYGFAHHVVRCIGDKEEAEIYELLDYWYGLDKRKTRQSFVDCVLEYIEKERRAGFALHEITPVKMKWINSWINPPIVRRALNNAELQKIFEDDNLRLKHYIEYCLTVDSMAKMAEAAHTYEVHDDFINITLYNALISIGMPNVGTYEGWKSATRRKK